MATRNRNAEDRVEAPLAWLGVVTVAALAGLVVLQAGRVGHAPTQAAEVESRPPVGYAVQAPPVAEGKLRYDQEYPTIPYSTGRRTDPVAVLAARIARGEVQLDYRPGRGYLDSLLAALSIDPSSQMLVFSQTSLQSRLIRPTTPRAIYFNDDVYVAWVQNGPLEIASFDPNLGPVFYLLEQRPDAPPRFDGQLTQCLSCHDSYSLTGGGVPRFIVGSGYIGTTGMLVAHEGWILTTDQTPLSNRWGGWYVTGRHGDQAHLGNLLIKNLNDFDRLDELRVGNLDNLDGLFNTKPYLTDKSDIVALLVFQHQTEVQNGITRLSYDTRMALAAERSGAIMAAEAEARIEDPLEELLRDMLFVDAVPYTAPISGVAAFVEQFTSRAVRDSEGRSLRDLDLTQRLFRYPFSYLVYSAGFDALPTEAKTLFYRRLADVLRGTDTSAAFAAIAPADRAAILAILRETKPEFAALLSD